MAKTPETGKQRRPQNRGITLKEFLDNPFAHKQELEQFFKILPEFEEKIKTKLITFFKQANLLIKVAELNGEKIEIPTEPQSPPVSLFYIVKGILQSQMGITITEQTGFEEGIAYMYLFFTKKKEQAPSLDHRQAGHKV